MIYLKNTQTNKIKSFEVNSHLQLSPNIRNQSIELTKREIEAYQLQEAKDKKIKEFKAIRDADDTSPADTHTAMEIVKDGEGNYKEVGLTGFHFKTKPSPENDAKSPANILINTLLSYSGNPKYYIPYGCQVVEGNSTKGTRNGVIKLTGALAGSLMNHVGNRNIANRDNCWRLQETINKAQTIEEINNLEWLQNDTKN